MQWRILSILLLSIINTVFPVRISEILDDQSGSLRIISGSGKSKFAIYDRKKTRHTIDEELLQKLQAIENLNIQVLKVDQKDIIDISKSKPLEDDLSPRVAQDENGRLMYTSAQESASRVVERFAKCADGNETELMPMLHPIADSLNRPTIEKKVSCGGNRSTFNGPLLLDNCTVKWYSRVELCEELEAKDIVIFLVGDTSVRQLAETLIMILRNNYINGGVDFFEEVGADTHSWCRCDGQFDDNHALKVPSVRARRCLHYSATKNDHDKICPQFSIRRVIYIPCWDARRLDVPKCLPNLRAQLAQYKTSKVCIYASIGIHFGLKIDKLSTLLHMKVADESDLYSNRTGKSSASIVGLIHTCDHSRKPTHYPAEQCGPKIKMFNSVLRNFSDLSGRHYLFDSELYTSDMLSIDGLNYGLKTMVPMAQLLFNFIFVVLDSIAFKRPAAAVIT